MRLNAKALALSLGILWAAAVFLVTVWLLLSGSKGETISALRAIYPGYTFSYLGAVIGLGYGFVHGLIGGWLTAALYNVLLPLFPSEP